MAFVFNNFETIDSAGLGTVKAFSVHKYTTNDTVSTVSASGYFNSITKMLSQGDLIMVSAGVAGTPASNVLIVSSATGAATVTTTGLSTVTQTYNSTYVIPMGLGASTLNTTPVQYHPVPTSGAPLRFYGCNDGAGASGSTTYRLTQVGGAVISNTMTFVSGYAAGTLITGTIAAAPALVAGTDVIKLDTTANANTGTGATHLVLVVG